MPKVTGPLYSLEAHGNLASVLTFQRRPGGPAVYGYKTPKVPLTAKQLLQRERIRWCVSTWQQLTDEQKNEWENKAKGQGQSGYSYFIKSLKGPILDLSTVLYVPLYDVRLDADPFQSRDSFRHLCDVTGAVWTSKGRSFDGVDDKITIPHTASLDNLLPYSQIIWVKFDAGYGEAAPQLIEKAGSAFANYLYVHATSEHIVFARGFADTGAFAKSADGFVPIDTWVCIGASLSALKVPKIYFNGAELGSYQAQRTGIGAITDDSGDDLIIGNRSNQQRTVNGKMGEVLEYNRELTAAEFQHNYLATKWRYQ